LFATLIILNTFHSSRIPIVLLVFAAYKAALGLSLLVIVSHIHGTDEVQNLNVFQC
ncbi:hypothetical protein DBR06_SOUSAS310036, partial [Sousa chinensis]